MTKVPLSPTQNSTLRTILAAQPITKDTRATPRLINTISAHVLRKDTSLTTDTKKVNTRITNRASTMAMERAA